MHRGGAVPGREIEVQAHGETGNAPGQKTAASAALSAFTMRDALIVTSPGAISRQGYLC